MTHPVSPESYQAAREFGGYVDFPNRARFRLSGGDRVRYLNGQVTNDVSLIEGDDAIYACVTNHKGKMDGDIYIAGEGDEAFLIDAPADLRKSLFLRLDKYIIADDAALTDVTDDWRLVHVLDGSWKIPGADVRTSNRFGEAGRDCWLPADAALPSDVPKITPALAEILRIERGIPRWGAELSPEVLPPEAKLESRAISFTKGCYIGQEVISRIRSVGRVNRTVERLEMVDGERLAPGMLLTGNDGKKAGHITSAGWHPVTEKWIGLGFVKRSVSEPGSRLNANSPAEAENELSAEVEVKKMAL
jgi:folate-binding protein YgfZ